MKDGVVLVGFMGAGKTSVGRHLAKQLKLPWVDTDRMIEEALGRKISEVFAQHGEAAFRELEFDTLEELTHRPAAVYSTGGGIVTRDENWAIMRQLGPIVYLRADPATLFERVRHHTHRPLLHTDNPQASFHALFEARREKYERADLVIDTDHRRSEDVASELATRLQEYLSPEA